MLCRILIAAVIVDDLHLGIGRKADILSHAGKIREIHVFAVDTDRKLFIALLIQDAVFDIVPDIMP